MVWELVGCQLPRKECLTSSVGIGGMLRHSLERIASQVVWELEGCQLPRKDCLRSGVGIGGMLR